MDHIRTLLYPFPFTVRIAASVVQTRPVLEDVLVERVNQLDVRRRPASALAGDHANFQARRSLPALLHHRMG